MIVVTSGLLAKASMYPPLPLSRERSGETRGRHGPDTDPLCHSSCQFERNVHDLSEQNPCKSELR
jgi:hypothetical protein